MSWAENVARGQPSAAAAMAAWLGSPGAEVRTRCRRNNFDRARLGVGAASNGAGPLYCTPGFGGR